MVADKGGNELINVMNIFCFAVVSHKSLKRGLILSRYLHEFTKRIISLSYLHPYLIVKI